MASHNQPGTVIPLHLHRMVALPVKSLDDLVRENGAEAQHREPVQFIPSPDRRPTLLERLADFFSSDRGISFQLGFVSGAFFCCGTLILWAKVVL